MNEGCGKKVYDLSGNGNIGSLVADTHFVPGKFGPALDFDGTGDYVTLPSKIGSLISNKITISAWIKVDTSHTDRFVIYEDYKYTVPKNKSIQFRVNTDETIKLFVSSDGTNDDSLETIATIDGNWHHIVVTFDAGAATIYIDGQKSISDTLTHTSFHTTGLSKYIGAYYYASEYAKGQIDHEMIYNRALSASEIALLYREPFCMFERAWIPKLIGGQIVELVGTSEALSSLSATAKATRKVGGTVASTSDVTARLSSIRGLAASTGGLATLNGSLSISGVIELIGTVAGTSSLVARLSLLERWVTPNERHTTDALFNGMTSNAFKLGTTLSLGWFWVRIAGCSVLYRGSGMREIDFANILAVAEQDACEISPPNYISHYGSANGTSTYFYVVRRFNNCGYQERTLAAAVRVSIESNGELAQPQPNKVFDSAARHADGNKICFVWFYCPIEQKSQPVCFNIYYDARTGQIDYENPLATIGYKGRKFYSFQSSALEAGKYLFAIRAEDAGGIENSSLARLKIHLDTASPEAVDILRAEAV